MNPGDVCWVEFPYGAGRAQAGRRPAIVVQSMAASTALPTVLVIPLTTQQDALRFPGTVLVEPDQVNRLRRPSVALAFQMTTIDSRFLSASDGRAADATMDAIWAAFDDITRPNPVRS